MSRYKDMRDKIVEILAAIQMDDGPAFAQIVKEPKDSFSGTPAATVVPAEVQSEIETNQSNLRRYGFNVHLHYPLNKGDSWTTAIDHLLELVDLTMDALDDSGDLDGLAHILEAAPLDWDVVQTGETLQLLSTIHVIAKVSISR